MPQAAAPTDRECVDCPAKTLDAADRALPRPWWAYLAHTEGGMGIRAIARVAGCPPSTILRQIRRIEGRRDDTLIDDALSRLSEAVATQFADTPPNQSKDWAHMIAHAPKTPSSDIDDRIGREARRILRRLCEKDAFLAVAETMEKAAVLRELVPGRHTRTAVVDRDVAHRFALLDWVSCAQVGKVARYVITEAGRAALKRLLEEDRQARAPRGAFAEAQTPFQAQHQSFGERRVMDPDGTGEKRVRYNLAESPLTVLGRKLDKSGQPYLTAYCIEAGERLREDFELAQLGPRTTQNWEAFLVPRQTGPSGSRGPAEGPDAARSRIHLAMEALGPGLWDVVFRVCCFLEGLEAAERRFGRSARSGKVVLRIGLQRLAQHYGIAPDPQAD